MGKRTAVDEYRLQTRGGQGVINIRTSERTGRVVSIKAVTEDEQLMLITRGGVVNRQRVSEIRMIGRATQGVRLVSLDEGDRVMDVARVIPEDDEEDGEDALDAAEAEAEADRAAARAGEPSLDDEVAQGMSEDAPQVGEGDVGEEQP